MKSIVKKVLCGLLVLVVLVGCFFAVDAYRTHKAREKVVIQFADWSEEKIAELYEKSDSCYVLVDIYFSYPPFPTLKNPDEREEHIKAQHEYYNEKNKQMSEHFQIPLERFRTIDGSAGFSYDTPDEFYDYLDYFYSLAKDPYIKVICVYTEATEDL